MRRRLMYSVKPEMWHYCYSFLIYFNLKQNLSQLFLVKTFLCLQVKSGTSWVNCYLNLIHKERNNTDHKITELMVNVTLSITDCILVLCYQSCCKPYSLCYMLQIASRTQTRLSPVVRRQYSRRRSRRY